MRPPLRIRLSTGWRRALPAAGLLALFAYLAVAVPSALFATWARVRDLPEASRDDARAALARFRGPEYAAAIDRIRAALPEDAEYLILEGDANKIVRFDLAPRRAVFGGNAKDLRTNVTREKLASLPRWTVVPSVVAPWPYLVETRVLAERGVLP